MLHLITVDPSVNHIGFAILQIAEEDDCVNWRRKVKAGTFETDPEERLETRVGKFCQMLLAKIGPETRINTLIVEYPTYQNSIKGKVAAREGYTIDLAYVCGLIVGWLQVLPPNVVRITPQKWKGTKPKTATQASFRRIFYNHHTLMAIDEHAIDAVMILYTYCKRNGIEMP